MYCAPAKLLLLGEYTVLDGGPALAVPLPGRSGCWEEAVGPPDPRLEQWFTWLMARQVENALPWPIDVAAFGRFVREGGRFRSDIPTGFGLGSSGALVAALVRRWGGDYPADGVRLREGLAVLESFFHGKSSGLDPLVSLTEQAVLLDDAGGLTLRPAPRRYPGLFLLDTGRTRHTAPLVAQYQDQTKESAYREALPDYLKALKQAAEAILAEDKAAAAILLRVISDSQAKWMAAMILPDLEDCWSGEDYCLKLCGAGGGGFYLGMTAADTLPELAYPLHWVDAWAELKQG